MVRGRHPDLGELQVTGVGGVAQPLHEFLAQSHTAALLVLHEGEPVFEWSPTPGAVDTPQPCYSITKSVLGIVAGVLIERGVLDPDRGVIHYAPELAHGGYRAVTVRDLLDMRTGGEYRETYGEHDEVGQLVKTRVGTADAPFPSVLDMVCRIDRPGLHDGPFSYRSLDTEALGLVMERATGMPMDQVAYQLVLGPLGCLDAQFGRDTQGRVDHSGGLSIRPRDAAAMGAMVLNSGAVGRHQIVSPYFIKDLRAGHPCDATAESEGSYRNQFWVPQRSGRELLALGIYGQMLWMDGASDTVFAKFSAWPEPSDPALLSSTYAVAQACAAALDDRPAHDITLAR